MIVHYISTFYNSAVTAHIYIYTHICPCFIAPCSPHQSSPLLPSPSPPFHPHPSPFPPSSQYFPILPPPEPKPSRLARYHKHFSIHCLSHIEIYRVIVRDRQVHPRKSFTFPSTSPFFSINEWSVHCAYVNMCKLTPMFYSSAAVTAHTVLCQHLYIYTPVVPINLPHSFLLPPHSTPIHPTSPLFPILPSQSPNPQG